MMRYLIQNKAKNFSIYATTYGPLGLGLYFDWYTADTRKMRELTFQILKLSVVISWDK